MFYGFFMDHGRFRLIRRRILISHLMIQLVITTNEANVATWSVLYSVGITV